MKYKIVSPDADDICLLLLDRPVGTPQPGTVVDSSNCPISILLLLLFI